MLHAQNNFTHPKQPSYRKAHLGIENLIGHIICLTMKMASQYPLTG